MVYGSLEAVWGIRTGTARRHPGSLAGSGEAGAPVQRVAGDGRGCVTESLARAEKAPIRDRPDPRGEPLDLAPPRHNEAEVPSLEDRKQGSGMEGHGDHPLLLHCNSSMNICSIINGAFLSLTFPLLRERVAGSGDGARAGGSPPGALTDRHQPLVDSAAWGE